MQKENNLYCSIATLSVVIYKQGKRKPQSRTLGYAITKEIQL